ncbi:MAG: hypothetical protein JWM88_1320 [Verrucomicrobia bacterium]|nr:hypothetical protein [Verrucomicrobiota bacterium]
MSSWPDPDARDSSKPSGVDWREDREAAPRRKSPGTWINALLAALMIGLAVGLAVLGCYAIKKGIEFIESQQTSSQARPRD